MNGEFYDRRDAGRRLAERLSAELEGDDVIVLGLPRGGVPVAAEVAEALGAPLEVFLVRKLGVPGHEELAMGAIASGGVRVLNEDVVGALGIGDEDIERVAGRELTELERRERAYREGRAAAELGGRTGVLVDDGLATGASMRAAVLAVRRSGAKRVIVAVPVAPRAACAALQNEADQVICLQTPEKFIAVGAHYDDFAEISDDEVTELLRRTTDASRRQHVRQTS
ncbi:MAG: phosphoribosyltransferase [Actinobacteria bacterium]|nr:MAG: phosphoribosyltransferase [Actinomycetota bacterium]